MNKMAKKTVKDIYSMSELRKIARDIADEALNQGDLKIYPEKLPNYYDLVYSSLDNLLEHDEIDKIRKELFKSALSTVSLFKMVIEGSCELHVKASCPTCKKATLYYDDGRSVNFNDYIDNLAYFAKNPCPFCGNKLSVMNRKIICQHCHKLSINFPYEFVQEYPTNQEPG